MAGAGAWKTVATAALVAAAALLSPVFAAPTQAAERVALVVGNAAYAHAPSLVNPLHDAEDIGAALSRLGFAVTRMENTGYATLRRGLWEFTRAASVSEMAVVFYAGHGIEVDQRNFLVPVDARLASDQDVEFEAVPLDLVLRTVARASGLRLVILDACRKNPFAASMRRAGAMRMVGRGLARVEPAGETLVAYAAKEGTVAADGNGRNSPYSEALLRYLEEPGLEVGLMFRKVRDAVLVSTGGRQEPFVYGSLSSRGTYLTARPVLPDSPSSTDLLADSQSATDRLAAERLAAERLSREEELLFWESVKDSEEAADLHAYLDRYPSGAYEALARIRLKRLEGASDGSEPPESTDSAAPAQEAFSVPVPAEIIGPTEAETIGPTEEVKMLTAIDSMAFTLAPGRLEAQQAPKADDETGAPPDASDDEGVSAARTEYLARLQDRLFKRLTYPHVARSHRQTGTALLYVAVHRTGRVQFHDVRTSTGHRLLDREVTRMVERARPFPPFPEEMREERLEVLLNVEFALE